MLNIRQASFDLEATWSAIASMRTAELHAPGYSLAGRGEGLDVQAAHLHELRNGTRRAVDISAEATGQALAAVTGRLEALREARFEAKPEPTRCSACEYAKICTHCPVGAVEG